MNKLAGNVSRAYISKAVNAVKKGLVIEVETGVRSLLGDVVQFTFESKLFYFEVFEIEMLSGETCLIKASELKAFDPISDRHNFSVMDFWNKQVYCVGNMDGVIAKKLAKKIS